MTPRPPAEPQTASAVLMIRPRHFDRNAETAASNRFQATEQNGGARGEHAVAADAQRAEIAHAARCDFDRLAAALEHHGVLVHRLEGRDAPVCPDEVFPNNWLSTHADGTLVLYPMLAPSRRLERRGDIADTLRRLGYAVRDVIDLTALETRDLFLEGTGSLVLDRTARLAFACASARTSAEAVRVFCERLGYEAMLFDAQDRDGYPIYHTNVMMSVGSEHAVICSESIRHAGDRSRVLGALGASGKRIIEIGYPQLYAFAGNLLELSGARGPVIALSRAALESLEPAQRAALAEHGTLAAVPIDTIETFGGGSVRCMLAEIHLPAAAAR